MNRKSSRLDFKNKKKNRKQQHKKQDFKNNKSKDKYKGKRDLNNKDYELWEKKRKIIQFCNRESVQKRSLMKS